MQTDDADVMAELWAPSGASTMLPAATAGGAAARWLHTLVQHSSDVIAVIDSEARLVYANPAAERILGFSRAEQIGLNLLDLLHPDDLERATAAFSRDISRPGAHSRATYRFRTAARDWRVLEVAATNCLEDPAIAGVVVNARDVTVRTNLTRALNTLAQGNQVLVRAADESSLLLETCRTIVEVGGYLLAWVGRAENDGARTVRPLAAAGQAEYLDGLVVTWGDEAIGRGPIGTAIRTRTVRVLKDLQRSRRFAPWQERAKASGLRTVCALPLIVGDETFGALTIYAGEPGSFDPEALTLLRELADGLAYGIGRLADARSLEMSEARFRALADAAPIGILEISSGEMVDYANRRIADITGRAVETLMGRRWLDAVHPEDTSAVLALIERVRPDRPRVTASFRVRRPDGEVRHVRIASAPKGEETDSGYVVAVADLTDEVRAQESLEHKGFYDLLTDLPNRLLFLDRLAQELAPRRRRGPSIAVLFLDIDRFKLVNDSLGHDAGDAVLREVGNRFARAVRAGETVARFGGDEFLFLLRNIDAPQDAVRTADRLLKVLGAPIRYGGQDLRITGSVGIVIPAANADSGEVLRDAETAMYQAKAAGPEQFALFDDDLHRHSVARFAMEGELRKALSCGEFEVFYQPVVEPASGQPMGAEALIRWRHPARGIVSPLEFISVAEDSGLIAPIGQWVFEEAVSQLAAWDANDAGPRLRVLAVNLSARQLEDPGTDGKVRLALERYGIAPGRVALEITESTAMSTRETTRRALAAFKELGLRVAIDDFGTGYSSLAYLHTLPVTTVKVDRSFVERLHGVDDSTSIVQAIIDMSHAMGLRVVAEGVSSEHLRARVSAMGCDLAQGFYWTPPLPAGEFAAWWQEAARRTSTLTGDR